METAPRNRKLRGVGFFCVPPARSEVVRFVVKVFSRLTAERRSVEDPRSSEIPEAKRKGRRRPHYRRIDGLATFQNC